jgi:hypothetical protein
MFFRSDSFVDLTLRILTGAILIVLVVALGLLAWNFLRPKAPGAPAVPIVEVAPKPAPAPAVAPAPEPEKSEVLLNPGQVYRCVIKGRTTFSERPCPDGEADPPKAKR